MKVFKFMRMFNIFKRKSKLNQWAINYEKFLKDEKKKNKKLDKIKLMERIFLKLQLQFVKYFK